MNSSIRRSKASHAALKVTVLLSFPLFGLILASVLFRAYSEGSFVNWHSLGKPPSAAVTFVGGDPWTVWFKAYDGQIYKGNIDECRNLPNECWEKDENVNHSYHTERGSGCETAFSNMKSPPAYLHMCFIVIDESADSYGETHYAVSMDGRVWYWKHNVSSLDSHSLTGVRSVLLCGGISIGILVGLIMFLYNQRSRKDFIDPQ